jgi:hypothetical protein
VICPATLKLNWAREMKKWLVRPLTIWQASASGSWHASAFNITIINYDILAKRSKELRAMEWDLIIADEAHYLKNPEAKRTQAALGKEKKGVWEQEPIKARRRILMTGTPIPNRPVEGWPIFRYLDPTEFRNFFGYAIRYCAAAKGAYGWDFSGSSNLPELQNKLRASIMIRRLKADVLTELPAKRRSVIEISANGASKAVAAESAAWDAHESRIDSLRVAAELSKAGSAEEYAEAVAALREAASVAFSEMSKIRHDTAVAKIPYVIEHLRTAMENGKVVCFCWHHDVILALEAAFNGRHDGPDLREMDCSETGRESREHGTLDVPLSMWENEGRSGGVPSEGHVERLSSVSAKETRQSQVVRVQDGCTGETASEEGSRPIRLHMEGYSDPDNLSAAGDTNTLQSQSFLGQQPLYRQDYPGDGLCAGEYLGDQLEGQRNQAQREHRRIGDVDSKPPSVPGIAVSLYGATPMDRRQAAVDRFQTDPECRLFIAGIAAAGVGITLTAASHVVFAELDWVPGNVTQCEDRCHRIGQQNMVMVDHLVFEGSIDARMARTLVEKQEVIADALDTITEAPEPIVPATPGRERAATESSSRAKITAEAAKLSDEDIERIHAGLRTLAAMDQDRARDLNGMGFSRIDCEIGHSLAASTALSARQAALGAKLVHKYRRQLGLAAGPEA